MTASLLLLAALAQAEPLYNQFRGPNRDGHSPDKGLAKEWPAGGPPLAWKSKEVGGGFSSVSFWGDLALTMGDVGDACYVLALKQADGSIAWKSRVGGPGGHNKYPGPRATPATDGKLVVALGQQGDLVCFELAGGKEVWRKNLEKDFGGRMMSGWRWSESPLLDGDRVLVTPGGSKGTVVALKKESGETVWRSGGLQDNAAYASLLAVEIGKVRQYVVLTDRSVAGIADKDGAVLWKADRPGQTAVIPTPIVKGDLVFVTSGYGVGAQAFRVSESGGKFSATQVYGDPPPQGKGRDGGGKKIMANHHGGVILVGDHLYGLDDSNTLKCVELATGKLVWEDRSVGKGSIACADGLLICRSESNRSGSIALVEASPAGYREKGRFDQPDLSGRNTWPHPAVFGGRLYIRDQETLLCYDVKGK